MQDFREELRALVLKAKSLHETERRINLESVTLVGELERRRAAVFMGMSSEKFATFIGLTANQYWKRAQAARVMRVFPDVARMVIAGETDVSLVALVSPKLTQRNASILLPALRDKTKREVEAFLSRVTLDGQLLDQEGEVELRLKLTESQAKVLDRAREVLSHGGHVPTLQDIMMKALDALLEKRDPMRKAERAAARRAAAPSPGKEGPAVVSGPKPAADAKVARRPAVPAAVAHAVRLRDKGRCTWTYQDGSRCPERMMLELDHAKMWCRGGDHTVDNLRLRCRRHNQFAAEHMLGEAFSSPSPGKERGGTSPPYPSSPS
jgi:hypothetical protein